MSKKLIMAFMAATAVAALTVAPAASASPVLTNSGGTAIAVGTSIRGVNFGNARFTGALDWVCTSVVTTGSTTTNSGNTFSITTPAGGVHFSGTGPLGDCTSALGAVKVTVNSEYCEHITGDLVTINGCTGNLSTTIEITSVGTCKYSTATVGATHNTNADAQVTISEQEFKKIEGGFVCPSSGKLDLVLALTTSAGGTLRIS